MNTKTPSANMPRFDSLEPLYEEFGENGFVPTARRPKLHEIDDIAAQIARVERLTYKHNPGDGIHYVPSPLIVCYIDGVWSVLRAQSYAAIWAHTDDICRAFGLDFATLRLETHPEEARWTIAAQDRAACERPARRDDWTLVLNDLRAARQGAFARYIESRIRAKLSA